MLSKKSLVVFIQGSNRQQCLNMFQPLGFSKAHVFPTPNGNKEPGSFKNLKQALICIQRCSNICGNLPLVYPAALSFQIAFGTTSTLHGTTLQTLLLCIAVGKKGRKMYYGPQLTGKCHKQGCASQDVRRCHCIHQMQNPIKLG